MMAPTHLAFPAHRASLECLSHHTSSSKPRTLPPSGVSAKSGLAQAVLFSCPEAETRIVVVQKAAHHRGNTMNSSELIGYLEEDGSIVRLKKEIAPSIKEFYDGLRIKGGSAPIIITIENKDVPVGSGHLKMFCLGYLDGILDVTELEYLASVWTFAQTLNFPQMILEKASVS